MMGDTNPNEDIGEQLKELGKNLREALRTAWESEERRKIQQEIEAGLINLRDSLNEAASDFSKSDRGQALKEEVRDFNERLKSGEVSAKVRTEITEALRKVNDELQKASRKPPSSGTSG
jgi:signal recognition particle GTPase